MATRKAARVLPEPVGAEMRVGLAGDDGWASRRSWGSVGEPNLVRNHSGGDGVSPGEGRVGVSRARRFEFEGHLGHGRILARVCSPSVRLLRNAW